MQPRADTPISRTSPPRRRSGFPGCARATIVLVLAASFIQHSCVTSYLVSGNSMLPSYVDGDRVVVARMPAFLTRPDRGDTVIAMVDGEVLIKRVLGLPGETVEIGDGLLLEDGHFLNDPVPLLFRRMQDMEPVQLGDDEYFLMGDHRRVSIDSREFGPISQDQVVGRVLIRISEAGMSTVAALGR